MSRNFPTDKDHIIDDMDERYGLRLSDEEYERLRKLTDAQLLLVMLLLARRERRPQPCPRCGEPACPAAADWNASCPSDDERRGD